MHRGNSKEGQQKGNMGLQLLRGLVPLLFGIHLVHGTWLACLLGLGNASIPEGGGEEAHGRNQQILLCLAFLARLALARLLYKKSISK